MVSVKGHYNITIDAEEMRVFDRARGMIPRSPAIEKLVRLANQDASILQRALACEPENEKKLRGMEE
jgi:hypothetical protein